MNIWYQWAMLYLYEIGGILLVAASFVLARKAKSLSTYLAVIAFCGFVAGGEIQKKAQSALVEAQQTGTDENIARASFYTGRVVGALGFFVGTGSLLWFAVKQQQLKS